MRLPILKKCGNCDGRGGSQVYTAYGDCTSGVSGWYVGPDCEGRGHEETDMFVDIPDCMPTIIESTG